MSVSDNVKRLQDRIGAACAKAHRDPSAITLVAVSKQKTVQDILSAAEAGIQHIGENRVEEGAEKIAPVEAALPGALTWHMVGHVQSRKAKRVTQLFNIVQSLDSLRLAKRFSRFAGENDQSLPALLEINISGEASKHGFAGYNWYQESAVKDRLWGELGELLRLPHLEVRGLMTMAPFNAEEGAIRRVFADLAALRDELQNTLGVNLPELSMGMTDDFEIAIAEGSTMIRVGRALFGGRS